MTSLSDVEYVREQYRGASNLEARMQIYRFGTNSQPFHRWLFDHLELPDGARVLEVGCGSGRLWEANAGRIPTGWEITLTDLSPGMAAQAREALAAIDRPFTIETADAQSLPYPDASFDAVVAAHMLFHVPDLSRALVEIRRVLRPSGQLFATTLSAGNMQELAETVRRVDPAASLALDLDFNLERGGEALSTVFPRVTLDHYRDMLRIPTPEPVLDYLRSGPLRFVAEGRRGAELAATIEMDIARQGAFAITTHVGLFEASA